MTPSQVLFNQTKINLLSLGLIKNFFVMFFILVFLSLRFLDLMNTFYQILKTMQQQKIKLLILLNKVLFEGVVTKLFFSTYHSIFSGYLFLKLHKSINKLQLIL
jgi:hypothetical protein